MSEALPPIVGHTSPDWDCIAALWLLQRHGGYAAHPVVFVNTGTPDAEVLALAAAVVDTGKVHDPATRRFDHHQDAALPSATRLVYDWLLAEGAALHDIRPLIDLIDTADRGSVWHDAVASRLLGIHALLGAYARAGHDDAAIYAYGCTLLDALEISLRHQAEARRAVNNHLVWCSDDGLIVALDGGNASVTAAAHEVFGARLAVFVNADTDSAGTTTYARGCSRLGGVEVTEPHVGDLVALAATAIDTPEALSAELDSWFRHPAGFFAGCGTRKAPRTDPPAVGAATIARAIDAAWER